MNHSTNGVLIFPLFRVYFGEVSSFTIQNKAKMLLSRQIISINLRLQNYIKFSIFQHFLKKKPQLFHKQTFKIKTQQLTNTARVMNIQS